MQSDGIEVAVRPLGSSPSLEAVICAFAEMDRPAILESSHRKTQGGRYSIFTANPVRSFRCRGEDSSLGVRVLGELTKSPAAAISPSQLIPFAGGWIGYVTYELGLATERIRPVGEIGEPAVALCFYDVVAVIDHAENQWYAAGIDWAGPMRSQRPSIGRRMDWVETVLRNAEISEALVGKPRRSDSVIVDQGLTKPEYLEKVRRILGYIEAGDVYQVNLTNRVVVRTTSSPLETYLRLRCISPSPFAAFLPWDDAAVMSSSPELFLAVTGRQVVSRPIKGTRARTGDRVSDAVALSELEQSEKDRAELAMIVDLMRNDLGRVCEYGSVRATEGRVIEEHPTVFQGVATVEGRLRGDVGFVELMESAFPGGSVTGAPKIRAMQIISELELVPRGVYCGCIGWIGLDGSTCLNLAIRTMVHRGREVFLHAGGGIVADSDPEAEYEEMQVKLSGMLRALGCEPMARHCAQSPGEAIAR